MTLYRITKEEYSGDLSGRGSEIYGGRWNSKGVPVLYTSEHRSLCLLEMLVHTSLEDIPKDLVLVEINIPSEQAIKSITLKELPASWKSYPYDPFTRQIGDELLNGRKHLAIRVPSVLVEDEYNYMLNPRHEDSEEIKVHSIKMLDLDTRFQLNVESSR